jgi:hypothetical protein
MSSAADELAVVQHPQGWPLLQGQHVLPADCGGVLRGVRKAAVHAWPYADTYTQRPFSWGWVSLE